jgi:hypothetical protein
MKLSELKVRLSQIYVSNRPRWLQEYGADLLVAHKAGFDAGAKAVMDEAESLADVCGILLDNKHCTTCTEMADEALARWQEFKEGNDE